jgi:hypothetical protein
LPWITAGSIASASASATSSGASGAGTANSIGTNTASVGTVKQAPISTRTTLAAAIASTYSAALTGESVP